MTYGVSRDEQGARSRDRKYVSECTAADVDAMKDIGTHTHGETLPCISDE